MIALYFSGTGNSKHIVELFGRNMGVRCFSIEEDINFSQLIASNNTVVFCYPIYGSRVPRIMREFVKKYMEYLKGKKVIIFCTQWIFSGDGARAFVDIFPKKSVEVIYAEHFFMPNNICNFFLSPPTSEKKIPKYIKKAEQKMNSVCNDITKEIIKKRGFNILSRILGLSQGAFLPLIEKNALSAVFVDDNCTQCKLCVSLCPMDNLEYQNGKIIHKSNCTICYRCINRCPEKAITVFLCGKVKKQYKGIIYA